MDRQPSFRPVPQLSTSSFGHLDTTPLLSGLENTQNVYVQPVYAPVSYETQIPSAPSPHNEPAQHESQEVDQMENKDQNHIEPQGGADISVVDSQNANERQSANEEYSCSLGSVTTEDVRAALAKLYSSKSCCWPKKAIKEMDITISSMWNCYYCTWDIYTEERSISETYRADTDIVLDTEEFGPIPKLWEYPISSPFPFRGGTITRQLPHTEHKMTCPECEGRCRVTCTECYGSGSCTQSRYDSEAQEWRTETVYCYRCSGTGKMRCPECEGRGHVIGFSQVTVDYQNYCIYTVIKGDDIPDYLLRDAESSLYFKEEGLDLRSPTNFANSDIQHECLDLEKVAAERRATEKRRINNQRLMVREIPIIQAHGMWKGKNCVFWVYGNNLRAYAPYCDDIFSSRCTIMFSVCF